MDWKDLDEGTWEKFFYLQALMPTFPPSTILSILLLVDHIQER
jgi:hypothetical protein